MEGGEAWVGKSPADDVLIDDGRVRLDGPDRCAGGASLLRGIGGRGVTAGKPESARRSQIVATVFEKVDATGDRAGGFDDALRRGVKGGIERAVDGEASRGLRQGDRLPPHAPVLGHVLD